MARRRKSYRITGTGFIFLGVTAFVLVAAINSQSNPLFFTFGLMVGAWLVALVIGALMLRRMVVSRLIGDHLPIGDPAEVSYRIQNLKKRWPCFAVQVSEAGYEGALSGKPWGFCVYVPAGGVAVVAAKMTASRRGVLLLKKVRLSTAFPFGILRQSVFVPLEHRMVVYSRIGTLSRELALRCRDAAVLGTLSTNIPGGQDEFYALREYRPGDNARAIHWKRTARTGVVMVREMTTDAPPQIVVALDLRGWKKYADGAQRVERAVELAASVVCHAFMTDFAVGLYIPGSGDESLVQARSGREYRARLLEALAVVDPQMLDLSAGSPPGERGKSRAQWLVVTLGQSDTMSNVVPAGVACNVLSLDQPGSEQWLRFPEMTEAGIRKQESGIEVNAKSEEKRAS